MISNMNVPFSSGNSDSSNSKSNSGSSPKEHFATLVESLKPLAKVVEPTLLAQESVTPTTSDKKKRVRKELPYKSIVRTRSQKLREEMERHEMLLSKVADFYSKKRFEPRMQSNDNTEIALATYIHNLRTAAVDPNVAVKVSTTLPWFQWTKKSSRLTDVLNLLGGFLLISSLTALYVGVQVGLRNNENIAMLRKWVEQTINHPVL